MRFAIFIIACVFLTISLVVMAYGAMKTARAEQGTQIVTLPSGQSVSVRPVGVMGRQAALQLTAGGVTGCLSAVAVMYYFRPKSNIV
jgi:hypothetical protein